MISRKAPPPEAAAININRDGSFPGFPRFPEKKKKTKNKKNNINGKRLHGLSIQNKPNKQQFQYFTEACTRQFLKLKIDTY